MSNAEHIFNWARNDQALCNSMRAARALPESHMQTYKAGQLVDVARGTWRQMSRSEDVKHYTSRDVLKAAIFMHDWDGES